MQSGDWYFCACVRQNVQGYKKLIHRWLVYPSTSVRGFPCLLGTLWWSEHHNWSSQKPKNILKHSTKTLNCLLKLCRAYWFLFTGMRVLCTVLCKTIQEHLVCWRRGTALAWILESTQGFVRTVCVMLSTFYLGRVLQFDFCRWIFIWTMRIWCISIRLGTYGSMRKILTTCALMNLWRWASVSITSMSVVAERMSIDIGSVGILRWPNFGCWVELIGILCSNRGCLHVTWHYLGNYKGKLKFVRIILREVADQASPTGGG